MVHISEHEGVSWYISEHEGVSWYTLVSMKEFHGTH